MPKIGIAELKKKQDEELLDLMGFKQQLEDFKSAVEEADKLEGEPRKKVERRVQEMFTPHIYPGDLKYTVESAKRKARNGKDEAEYCGCDIID